MILSTHLFCHSPHQFNGNKLQVGIQSSKQSWNDMFKSYDELDHFNLNHFPLHTPFVLDFFSTIPLITLVPSTPLICPLLLKISNHQLTHGSMDQSIHYIMHATETPQHQAKHKTRMNLIHK